VTRESVEQRLWNRARKLRCAVSVRGIAWNDTTEGELELFAWAPEVDGAVVGLVSAVWEVVVETAGRDPVVPAWLSPNETPGARRSGAVRRSPEDGGNPSSSERASRIRARPG
jgi:hypothetical protein